MVVTSLVSQLLRSGEVTDIAFLNAFYARQGAVGELDYTRHDTVCGFHQQEVS